MRIEGPGRTTPPTGAGATRKPGGTTGFTLPDLPQTRATTVPGAGGAYDVAALIALQAVEGPAERKRKAVKRGFDLLDVLDDLRVELLAGRVGPERLERLATILAQKPEVDDPKLGALLDDIELRALVELAKRGRYPE